MVVVFFLCILAHEMAHALLYPDGGRSDSTVLILNWKKLQFGVYYEGCIPRGRWIAMRLLPLLLLTALPQAALMLFYSGLSFAVETYLIIMILANSLGSGGDLVAVLIVLRQVPPGGVLEFSPRARILAAGKIKTAAFAAVYIHPPKRDRHARACPRKAWVYLAGIHS